MSIEPPPTTQDRSPASRHSMSARPGASAAPRIAPAEWIAVAGVLCVAFALRAIVVAQSAAQDDAYITYRYAANLGRSLGFVYNAGERVLGTTTPLFTLVLGLLARFGLSPEVAAPWLGVVFDVAIGLVGWWALRTGTQRLLAWLWLVFYSTFYIPLQACTHGMESQLFVLCVLASMLAFERRHFAATGSLAGLAFLVRVEAALLLPLFWLEQRLRDRRFDLRAWLAMAAGGLVVVLPWFVFALSYFGTVIPNSLTAKRFGTNATFADWADAFIGRNPLLVGTWVLFAIGAVVLLRGGRATPRLWLGWTAAYLLFMLLGRPPFYATWYVPAVMPGLLLGAAAAALALAAGVRLRGRAGPVAIVMAWLAVTAFVWPRNLAKVRAFRDTMHSVYVPIGRWIGARTGVDESVFAGDIGYVGWGSQRRILDAAGLVSPEVWRFYREHPGDPASHVRFIVAERPRFVIASTRSPNFVHWTLPEFTRLYEPVERFTDRGADAFGVAFTADYTIFSLREGER
jgi:hypothetical protein